MRFETLTRTLLLGVALSASPVPAAEIAAPAAHLSGSESTSRPSAAKDVSDSQQQRPAEKARRKTNDHRATADTEATLKKSNATVGNSTGEAGETVPENIPPAEPPHLALRGVRG